MPVSSTGENQRDLSGRAQTYYCLTLINLDIDVEEEECFDEPLNLG